MCYIMQVVTFNMYYSLPSPYSPYIEIKLQKQSVLSCFCDESTYSVYNSLASAIHIEFIRSLDCFFSEVQCRRSQSALLYLR